LKMKLEKAETATVGHVERIPGMTQAAMTAILIMINKIELERPSLLKRNEITP